MLIDCDECEMQGTATCNDCVVTVLCGQITPREVGEEELAALDRLAVSGLVPKLRLVPRREPRAS